MPHCWRGGTADYERTANLGRLTANKVFRDRIEPQWFAGNTQFWYRVATGPMTHEFVRVDAAKAMRSLAFDHHNWRPTARSWCCAMHKPIVWPSINCRS